MTGLLELSVAGRKARPDFWNYVLPDEKHDRTIGIKCCQTKSTTGLLELSVAGRKARPDFWNYDKGGLEWLLPDEKHDQTIGIKVREVLPDEKHDWTIGIKYCQTKSTTGLLELSVAGRKTFGIKDN
ncbi:hypothetical protein GLOIN_2v1884393 [Rhizophagus clarus]|uniref:Uncharacterized protein n=1 Tax=Rhizophagus clarus TaxID=94130 RepID=A0A8H3M135_9GLOM|nr:hypothetical protein GLOIN_2v1884393 [Rhizophagus clarus]